MVQASIIYITGSVTANGEINLKVVWTKFLACKFGCF